MKFAAKILAVAACVFVALFPAVTRAQTGGYDSDFPPPPRTPSLDDIISKTNTPGSSIYGTNAPAVFFPPGTPVYGTTLANPSLIPAGNLALKEPPDGLGNYVNEFFYPALSTHLFAKDLDKKLARRLEAYIAMRTALVNELQNTLVALQSADPATRERELRAFAVEQTPRIAAHEAEAEQLREKIVRPGLTDASSVDWSRDREWQLGDVHLKGNMAVQAEFQVMRATAYYQNGLIAEQRGLLWEIAMEQQNRLPMRRVRARPTPGSTETNALFFSPETSRATFPLLTPSLSTKVAAYIHDKDALKDELREAVLANDRLSAGKRTAVFKELADRQWPRLAALEELAEQIRRELVLLPPPAAPPLPPQIPPALVARLDECRTERAALENERAERMKPIVTAPLLGVPGERRHTPLAIDEIRTRITEHQQAVAQADADFRKENADRYEALTQKIKAVAADLMIFAQAHTDPLTGQPMDTKILLSRINASEQYFARNAREEVIYKNYRIAMLEPGLSPEQRRLLFGAALVGLAQALPNGESFPTGRFPRFF